MSSVQYFNEIADKWNVIRSDYFEERLKYKVLSKTNVKDNVVADLGCGTGFLSVALALDAKTVFSLDQSRNMLRQANEIMRSKNFNNVYLMESSLENLILFDESVDVTFINMALHHVKDAKRAIEEMYRVIKRGGRVVIADVQEHDGKWAKEEMYDEWLGFSNSQIDKYLKEVGFKNIQIENTELKCKGYSSKGEYTEAGIFIAAADKEE